MSPAVLQDHEDCAQKISCSLCSKTFSKKGNLTRHLKINHGVCQEDKYKIKCSRCAFKCANLQALRDHLNCDHDEQIREKKYQEFKSLTEFREWKCKIEKEHQTSFVQNKGIYKMVDGDQRIYYHCHRSGTFKSRGTGKYKLKAQGSCKAGVRCPAEMVVTIFIDKTVAVEFYESHHGHSKGLEFMVLTQEERAAIAGKLKDGLPIEAILEDIRNNTDISKDSARLFMTTRKDIHNICKSFGLAQPDRTHDNETISVDMWVEKLKNSNPGENPVIYYKQSGEECPLGLLPKDEFGIALMTPSQKDKFARLATKTLCIDSINGNNTSNFQLTTVLAVDENGEVCPVAFYLSSKTNSSSMKAFYNSIKSQIGEINVEYFMSDDAFYNVWCEVMGKPEHKLLSTWHVDKAWTKACRSKIQNKEKSIIVYKTIKSILLNANISEFDEHLKTLLIELESDEKTQEFYKYFKSTYANRPEQWAHCYRNDTPVNTSIHLEAMRRVLKHIYSKGNKVKRVDTCIMHLQKMIRDKEHDKLIKSVKGKITSTIAGIRERHKLGLNISPENISVDEESLEPAWFVQSATGKEIYRVQKVLTRCTNCKLVCTNCKTCIHEFECNCIDGTVHRTLCKHVHAVVHKYLVPNETDAELQGAECSDTILHHSDTSKASVSSVQSFPVSNLDSSSEDPVMDKLRYFMKIYDKNKCDEKTKKAIVSDLDKMIEIVLSESKPEGPNFTVTENVNASEKLEKQPKFGFISFGSNQMKRKNPAPANSFCQPIKYLRLSLTRVQTKNASKVAENICGPSFDHTYF